MKRCLVSITMIVIFSLVAACATPPPPPPAATSAPAATAAPAATSAPTPTVATAATKAPAGKLVVGTVIPATTLDPGNAANELQMYLINIFDPLVEFDENMKIRPNLAESWQWLDLNTWQFNLRKGVNFHNGEPFDAKVAKFSFDRLMSPVSKNGVVQTISLDRVEIVNDYAIKMITKQPVPSMLQWLTLMYIVPPKYYTENPVETVAKKPVGSGPFKFVEWPMNDVLTLEANTEYWKGAPSFKTLVFRPIPEVGARVAELKSGGVDVMVDVPPDQVGSVQTDATRVEAAQGTNRMHVGFHITKGSPLEDKRVRQALNYAVDVDAIIKNLLGGYGQRSFNLVLPADLNPKIKPYTYDPTKAKQLLAEAGYSNGFDATLDTSVGRYTKDKDVSQAVADYLTKVGVRTTVKPLEWSVYNQMQAQRKTDDLYFLGMNSNAFAQSELDNLHHEFPRYPGEWRNADYLTLLGELRKTTDEKKRQELSFKLQEIAYEDPPWIYGYFQWDLYGMNKRVDWKPYANHLQNFYATRLVQ